MTKDERIEAETARMMEIYQDLPEDTLTILRPLIQNAAFMKITLEDLQEEIKEHGAVDTYTNGANQSGRKQSAAVQAYNQIIKNYNNAMKILSAKMPVVKEKVIYYQPPVPQEKTAEDYEREMAEQMLRDEKVRMELEKASRLQHEQWARQGKAKA